MSSVITITTARHTTIALRGISKTFLPFICFNNWWLRMQRRKVMLITIDWAENTIKCCDWSSDTIRPFTGQFNENLWEEIKKYCRTESVGTHIYIYGRKKDGYLAYCEPVEEYFDDINLLKAGQGYSFANGKKHPRNTPPEVKCPSCGHILA